MRRSVAMALARIAVCALAGAPAFAQTYEARWWTVDGGGVMGAAGGAYVLSGTVGQPDAGPAAAGGAYTLAGGYWGVALPGSGLQADLSIALSDAPDPVVGLQSLTYTVAVANGGPSAASSVTVSHHLPPGVVFETATGTGWACAESAGVVTCTRSALASGAAPSIAVVVAAPAIPQVLSSTASAAAVESDPVPANDSSTQVTVVTAAPTADLAMAVSDGGVEARWGQSFTWTITASNGGPQPVGSATVTDVFPAGVSAVGWSCLASAGSACPPAGSGNINAPVSLLVGGTATFTATGLVTPGTPALANAAHIGAPAGVHDPNQANNTAAVTTLAAPIGFYPVTPCRVMDTRIAPPALPANGERTFAAAGSCGVPADARALAVILVAVNPGDLGNLRLYPAGTPLPNSSTLNFRAGRTRANSAIIALGSGGQLSVRCDMPPGSPASTHFIVDVFGYFR